jgi:hypothetical protein
VNFLLRNEQFLSIELLLPFFASYPIELFLNPNQTLNYAILNLTAMLKNVMIVLFLFTGLYCNAQLSLATTTNKTKTTTKKGVPKKVAPKKVVTPEKEPEFLLEEGTLIKVKSLADISSKTAKEGDRADFAIAEDVEINGKVVIKEGTLVDGNIESVQKAKGLGKQGSITINFSKVKATNGSTVPIRSTKNAIQGKNKGGASVVLALVLSPLFLLKKGKEAKIPEQLPIEARV